MRVAFGIFLLAYVSLIISFTIFLDILVMLVCDHTLVFSPLSYFGHAMYAVYIFVFFDYICVAEYTSAACLLSH